ncbi:MAG: DUF1877 family protein [Chitinophagaceae bacterium]
MGISLKLYRTPTAEQLEDLAQPGSFFQVTTTPADLYKMHEDLAYIFTNNTDPFDDTGHIAYITIFGHPVQASIGDTQIGGFIPSSDIKNINAWIRGNDLNSRTGFYALYNSLNEDVVQMLDDIGSPTKEELYDYVQQLTSLYEIAEKENNSVIVCGT